MEAAWEIVDPALGDAVPVHPYARGTWGPKEADRLLADRETLARPGGVILHRETRPRRDAYGAGG